MRQFYILGHSNAAVCIILDTLHTLYPAETLAVAVVSNIPPEENDTLHLAVETPGIILRNHLHIDWQPEANLEDYMIGSIGKSRKIIFNFFQEKYGISAAQYRSLVHPSAVLAHTVAQGRGLNIGPLSVVAPHATLGDFVVLNRGVSVGHHTVLSDFVNIRPGANVAGSCHLGVGVTIGAGAVVIDRISIGEGTIVGAGSVVTKDLPAQVVAYGSPAKVIRSL